MLSTGAIVGSKTVGVSVALPIVGAPVSLTGALVGSSAVYEAKFEEKYST